MKKVKQSNYERASQLLGKLFDVDSDIVEQINTGISHNGIRGFFKNLDAYDFSGNVYDKLTAVKRMLFATRMEPMPKYILHEHISEYDSAGGGVLK